jgi:hypothetical protein
MWSDGGPIDPSPTIDQAINGGYSWLEIKCSRCKTPRCVDLAALKHAATTRVHDLASRLICQEMPGGRQTAAGGTAASRQARTLHDRARYPMSELTRRVPTVRVSNSGKS